MFGNLDIGQRFRKNLDFGSVPFFGNTDIGQSFRKILFLAKISKISNLSNFQKFYLFLSFFIIPNLVTILLNPDFFFKLTKNHDFSEIL